MIDCMNYILKDLSEEQANACKAQGNVLLTACPGSGKTRTLTHRLAYQVDQKTNSNKMNIAITYTNRAAEEITSRLCDMRVDLSNIWTGTIHQFCMNFIIRPYAMYSKRLCKGYRIIAYESLLVEKKEIDFDMILRFSEELLSSFSFIGTNIALVINSILVDEFQDTNELQYSILAHIYKANKAINMMFIGDINQAIYGSLGGVAKSKENLESLYETTFEVMSLKGCYRSTQRLVDLYSNFEVSKTKAYSVAEYKDVLGKINYSKSVYYKDLAFEIASLIKSELKSGIKAEEICVIAPQWFMLFDLSNKLRSNLPDVSFDAPDISPIKYDPLNPMFLLAKLLFMPSGKNVSIRKRIATEFIKIVKDDLRIMIPDSIQNYDILSAVNCCRYIDADGLVCLDAAIKNVFSMLKVCLKKESSLFESINSFFSQINYRVERYSLATDYNSISKYFGDKNGVVISTIHGVKGEEYNTVIAVGLLNGYLPHWDYIIKPEKKPLRQIETKKLLYVLCSRAKENLYLFSEHGRTTANGSEYTPTGELALITGTI